MIQNAYIKSINVELEEEITILVGEIEIVCFASVCPYAIYEKSNYLIEIHPIVLNDTPIKLLKHRKKELKRIDNTFRYKISGYVDNNGSIDAGILLSGSDVVLIEEENYYNQFVEIEVDRLDIEFI